MKTLLFYSPLFLLSFLFSACTNNKNDEEPQNDKKIGKLKNEGDFEDKIAAIENNSKWKIMNSLAFNNNEGSREEVIAYLNEKDEAVKLEEVFFDALTGNYGRRIFYAEGGKKFASKEVFFDNQKKVPQFIERISFYNKKQVPIYTRERSTALEEDLENQMFEQKNPVGVSIDRAMQIINQQGPFETTFQGFVQNGGLTYILVGENTPDGFASSLAVQYESSAILKLRKNERGMIGIPLEVQHQTMMDEQGLKFQILLNISLL
jgi:hypothetical protein